MSTSYHFHTDPVIQALIDEARNDSDVIGLVLLGSRAIGGVTSESDYDMIFLVTEEAHTRYNQTQIIPVRGSTITPSINTKDIWHDSPSQLQLGHVINWMLPAYAESIILYDRTGETTQVINALRYIPTEQMQTIIASWYDAYLNGLYRSLKAWRRGNILGGRMEAAHTADYMTHLLFALERHWRPYSSRLIFHLHKLEVQGWKPDEVSAILLDLISTGDPTRQQMIAKRIIALLNERGFGHIYDAWDGDIERVLMWQF